MTTAHQLIEERSLFDQWAAVYDTDPNPLLALEERVLPSMLPAINGAHVLDVGCGTGRWLRQLEQHGPASLTGIDPSAAMLTVASRKLAPATTLLVSSAASIDLPNSAYDILLSSFVVSYIEELGAFAMECARILKPGGFLCITDMHPVSAEARNWTRSFKLGQERIRIPSQPRVIQLLITFFEQCGFALVELQEPCFAEPERHLFVQAGKEADLEELRDTPAIYLLKLQKQIPLQLINARSSKGPNAWSTVPLNLAKGRINTAPDPEAYTLDLRGCSILPGLINAHDHLEFALFPNLGRGPAETPYNNSRQWADGIHQSHTDTIAAHCAVPLDTRVEFGLLRNLLAGVTTVCHHNPIHSKLTEPGLPIRIVTEMGWAHSLAFSEDLTSRFNDSPTWQPFILHAAEGTDDASREELSELDRLNLLAKHTVLVHGVALTKNDIKLLNLREAALIFCPTSNQFLFSKSPSREVVESTQRAALASDSPITAKGDLLDEIRYLRGEKVDPGLLFNLVTTGAADVLGLRDGRGTLEPDTPADLIAVRTSHTNPADTLGHLEISHIELVIAKGQIQLVSSALYQVLPTYLRAHLRPIEIDGLERWVNAPLPILFADAERVLGHDTLQLGNKAVRYRNPL